MSVHPQAGQPVPSQAVTPVVVLGAQHPDRAESFLGPDQLRAIQDEARELVDGAFRNAAL